MTLILRPSLLALGLTLALTACGRAAPLTEQEQRTVTELTSHMKTRCVGRYLIDLPADVQTSGSATLQGVQVSTKKMTQQKFLKEMQQREAELRGMKHLKGYLFFYGDSETYVNKSAAASIRKEGIWYFIHMREIYEAPSHRSIEVYKWDHGYRVKLEIAGADYRNDTLISALSLSQLKPEEINDVDQKISNTLYLARHFRGLADDDIPTGPGVCFEGGFIAKKAEETDEVDARFIFSDKQDVNFVVRTDSILREKPLLQRHEQINEGLAEMEGGKTIRDGRVALPQGLGAEEWLLAARLDSGVHGHFFTLEANALANNAKTPFISLEMTNGDVLPQEVNGSDKPSQASLTEGEAVALWDAVSRTIRLRPGAMDAMPLPMVSATESRLPLGTVVCSGQACRQGGYYRTHWNGKTYRELLYPNRPAPTLKLMEPVPYRWLPGLVNRMLLKQDRLPMALAEHAVNWELAGYLL